jgi:threonine dehydrogenase-like Zn-dependent dehydrogenase
LYESCCIEANGNIAMEEMPAPRIQDPGDAIVRVTTAGVCGSDLHIIHGRDKGIRMGTIMGHEFTGIVEEVGNGVSYLRKSDRVVAPFTVNCGSCFYCKRDLPARCIRSEGFGFITEAGKGLHGAQAEFVRVPLADSTLVRVPEKKKDGSQIKDEEILFLGDIFSTAYSCAEKAEIRKGDVVTVIGCGPVGLLCILAARLFEPSAIIAVDSVDYRLDKAKSFGAITASPDSETLVSLVKELTEGRGADAALEAVGHSSALDLAIRVVRPGGVVSIAGYHTDEVYPLPIQTAYTKNLTVKIGRCNARKYLGQLLPLVVENRVPMTHIITHTLPLKDALHGYDLFTKKLDSAIKVLLKP